ncbi:hypothetical protein HDU96_003001 [Phlyctochytrium bullatum]|nr:hypothetical protein HDU96_003001 [Phlyctochytrium bullatum]
MVFHQLIIKQSTLKNFLLALGAFVVSLGLIRRTNWLLFGSGNAFAFNPDLDATFGYTGVQVLEKLGPNGLSFFGRIVALLGLVGSAGQALTFAAVSAIIISSAITLSGGKAGEPLQLLNQFPAVPALLQIVEGVIFFLGINSSSTSLIGLAGYISFFRSFAVLFSVGFVMVSIPFLGKAWTLAIGRDGRQRVVKEKAQ